ncbi:hypothetical protein [Amycolatopsis sp. La24]|uniref:hypothetical protein n=1 Tax=Amycolatopsis sp. La24 TaxID=3028304 RepID=UPI0023B087BA|nr:hypothetical protein [Amycolatopsis sp. La24]
MPRKEDPAPATVTVVFEGPGPEAYEAIIAEHEPRLTTLSDQSASPGEAARLRALAAQLSRLRDESRANRWQSRTNWLPLIRYASDSYPVIGAAAREAVTALVDAYLAVHADDDRAEVDSVEVNRALRILARRRPDAYAAVAAVLSGPTLDPTAEQC